MFAGDLIVTMVLATFWTLLFESPIIILEKVIFGTGKYSLILFSFNKKYVTMLQERKGKKNLKM